MGNSDFQLTLQLAICGNQHAVARILSLYAPLIEHASLVSGHPDEDLRQFIYLRIITALCKFRI